MPPQLTLYSKVLVAGAGVCVPEHTIDGRKVMTTYWAKPIPDRRYDWSAIWPDTYDGEGPIGHGPTEEAAIADLIESYEP